MISGLEINHTTAQQTHPLVLTLDMKHAMIRLQLRPESAPSTIRTEWLGETYRSSNEVNRMCMFEGTLDGATEPTATISICNGIVSVYCLVNVFIICFADVNIIVEKASRIIG